MVTEQAQHEATAREIASRIPLREEHHTGGHYGEEQWSTWHVDVERATEIILSALTAATAQQAEELKRLRDSREMSQVQIHRYSDAMDRQAKVVAQQAEEIARLKDALMAVRSPVRGYPCWCDESHNAVAHGHQPKCQASKLALSEGTRT